MLPSVVGLTEHVTPLSVEGTLQATLTAPLNPLFGTTVSVALVEAPAATVRVAGDDESAKSGVAPVWGFTDVHFETRLKASMEPRPLA